MRIPEQGQRLAIVIGVIVAGVLVTRFVLIPRHLIASDLHQSSTVQREMAKPAKFAGSSVCQACHEDIVATKAKAYHRNLACEGCHGPAVKHAEDPSAVKPLMPRDRKFCPVCHAYDSARPTGFPQINPTAHNPLKPCNACHNPHDPTPPRMVKECSACHTQIERMKEGSSHALLACTACHKVPQKHKTSPRSALPSKPETREFCGGCHEEKATVVKEAPKVDMSQHGRSYLCWECHYPHLPEGRT